MLRPLEFTDLSEWDRRVWLESGETRCPGATLGRFLSPDHEAWAVLLINAQVQPNRIGALVVVPRGPKSPEVFVVNSGEMTASLVVDKLPAGEYEESETGRVIKSKVDIVVALQLEAASRGYYWTGSDFSHFQISE